MFLHRNWASLRKDPNGEENYETGLKILFDTGLMLVDLITQETCRKLFEVEDPRDLQERVDSVKKLGEMFIKYSKETYGLSFKDTLTQLKVTQK